MYDTIVTGLSAILSALPTLKSKSKNIIGRDLAKLYLQLDALYEDGKKIVNLLESINDQSEVDKSNVIDLVIMQSARIKDIKNIIKKSNFEKILKIHLLKFKDLTIYIEGKGQRIALLKDDFEKEGQYRFMHPESIENLYMFNIQSRWSKLIKPSSDAIQNAFKSLEELQKTTETLRIFLTEKFEVNEII